MAAIYERHLEHILTYRGIRGQDEKLRITLCLMPRFSFKTTLGVVVFCIWATTIEPNITIVIGSRREDLASKSLGSIKRIFESHGPYIERFGRQKPESKEQDLRLAWAASGIVVAGRTDHALKERTIEVVGVRSLDPGFHYDIGLWDDPHGDDSPEEIEMTWNALRNYVPISHPWGVIAVTMTVWDDMDVPIRMETEWQFDLAEKLFQPACTPDFSVNLMPELYSDEQLQTHKRLMGSYKATCQFALVRQAEEDRRFPSNLYREQDIPVSDFSQIFMALDPAFMKEGPGSEHAITVLGILPGGFYHVLDAEAGVWPEEYLTEKLMDHIIKWRPHKLGIEKVAVTNWIRLNLEPRLRQLRTDKGQRRPTIVPLVVQGARSMGGYRNYGKIERIRSMVEPYKTGRLTFSREITQKDKLKQQLHAFPRGNMMDLIDSLGYYFHMITNLPVGYMDISDSPQMRQQENPMEGWMQKIVEGRSHELPWMQEEGASWSMF